MKTAVQQAIEIFKQLSDSTYFNGKKSDCDIIDRLTNILRNETLETEKQQIIDSYKTGRNHDFNAFEHAGDYYYKNFNNQ